MPIEAFSPLPADNGPVPAAGALIPAAPSPRLYERRLLCLVVRQLTAELLAAAGNRDELRRGRRRASCHVRQMSMYICHVALAMAYGDIDEAFGVDRTTVAHACHCAEDRRDDPGFDAFVSSVERLAETLCMIAGRPR